MSLASAPLFLRPLCSSPAPRSSHPNPTLWLRRNSSLACRLCQIIPTPMKRRAPILDFNGEPASDSDDEAAVDAPKAKSRVRILTWNIDMDTKPINLRCRALVDAIRKAHPDVVMLQEVTATKDDDRDSSVLTILRRLLCTEPSTVKDAPVFDMHLQAEWNEIHYFAVMLVRRGFFRPETVQMSTTPFVGSVMGRGLIGVDGELAIGGAKLAVLTSHFESLPMGSVARTSQLVRVVALQREYAKRGFASVFGGDTNLREKEINKTDICKTAALEAKRVAAAETAQKGASASNRKKAKVEPLLGDAWVMNGCNDSTRYTWDTSKNDNLTLADLPYKPKARYDRVFVLGPDGKFPEVVDFKLLGTKRLPSCDKFISDHFGVLVDIDLAT